MSRRWIAISISVFIIIILLFSFLRLKKANTHETNELTTKNVDRWYEPTGDLSSLDIYVSENEVILSKPEDNITDLDESFVLKNKYMCSTKECGYYGTYKNYVIIKDGKYLIYDFNKNKALDLNLPDAIYNNIEICGYKDKIYGLSISNVNDEYAYYSLGDEEFKTEFKYGNINSFENISFTKNLIITSEYQEKNVLNTALNIKTGKIKFSSVQPIYFFGNKKHIYLARNYAEGEGINAEIYNENFKLLFDGQRQNLFTTSTDGNLIVVNEDNTFSMYNYEGTFIKVSKKYKEIVMLNEDYLAVIDNDNYLKLVNFDGNLIAKFILMDDKYTIYSSLSGWKKVDNKTGIFIVLSDNSEPFESENHALYYYYVPKTKETGVIKKSGMLGY